MDKETARKAIDFVIQSSQNRRNIEVDFFGGEPLMAMDVVRDTVEYARQQEKYIINPSALPLQLTASCSMMTPLTISTSNT